MSVDYQALLKKYIEHVRDYEGMSFISLDRRSPDQFTEDEWTALRELDGTSDEQEDEWEREAWQERLRSKKT